MEEGQDLGFGYIGLEDCDCLYGGGGVEDCMGLLVCCSTKGGVDGAYKTSWAESARVSRLQD